MARVYGLEYQKLHISIYSTLDKSLAASMPFAPYICDKLIPDDIVDEPGRTQLRTLWKAMIDYTNSVVSSTDPESILDAVLDQVSDIILAAKQHKAVCFRASILVRSNIRFSFIRSRAVHISWTIFQPTTIYHPNILLMNIVVVSNVVWFGLCW